MRSNAFMSNTFYTHKVALHVTPATKCRIIAAMNDVFRRDRCAFESYVQSHNINVKYIKIVLRAGDAICDVRKNKWRIAGDVSQSAVNDIRYSNNMYRHKNPKSQEMLLLNTGRIPAQDACNENAQIIVENAQHDVNENDALLNNSNTYNACNENAENVVENEQHKHSDNNNNNNTCSKKINKVYICNNYAPCSDTAIDVYFVIVYNTLPTRATVEHLINTIIDGMNYVFCASNLENVAENAIDVDRGALLSEFIDTYCSNSTIQSQHKNSCNDVNQLRTLACTSSKGRDRLIDTCGTYFLLSESDVASACISFITKTCIAMSYKLYNNNTCSNISNYYIVYNVVTCEQLWDFAAVVSNLMSFCISNHSNSESEENALLEKFFIHAASDIQIAMQMEHDIMEACCGVVKSVAFVGIPHMQTQYYGSKVYIYNIPNNVTLRVAFAAMHNDGQNIRSKLLPFITYNVRRAISKYATVVRMRSNVISNNGYYSCEANPYIIQAPFANYGDMLSTSSIRKIVADYLQQTTRSTENANNAAYQSTQNVQYINKQHSYYTHNSNKRKFRTCRNRSKICTTKIMENMDNSQHDVGPSILK